MNNLAYDLSIKCIHEIAACTCVFCKDKPEYNHRQTFITTKSGKKAAAGGLKNDQDEHVPGNIDLSRGLDEDQNDQMEEGMSKKYEICLITGCGRKCKAHGLCDKHLQQWKKGKFIHLEYGTWEDYKKSGKYKPRLKKTDPGKTVTEPKKLETFSPTFDINAPECSDLRVVKNMMVGILKQVLPYAEILTMYGFKGEVKKEIARELHQYL